MNPSDNIEKIFTQINIETNTDVDKVVLGDAVDAMSKSKQNTPVCDKPDVWRIIMKSRITKFAAAAVIIIAVLIGISQFGGSIDGASVAFGQMKQALEKVLWVHSVNNNSNGSDEGWLSFTQQIEINKKADGKITYEDYGKKTKYVYLPETETITRTDIVNKQFALGTTDIFAFIDTCLDKEQARGAQLSHKSGLYNRKPVEIWEITRSENNWAEEVKMFIDTETDLPVAVEVKSGGADGKPGYVGNVTFDYPQDGPQNIYALGVPQSTKIVDLSVEPDVLDVLHTYQKHRNEAPSKYAAVVVFDIEEAARTKKDVFGYATIVYRDGQCQYGRQYTMFGSADEYIDQIGDTFDSAMNLCKQSNLTQLTAIDLFNGVHHYQSKYNEDGDKWVSQPRRDYPAHLGNYLEVLRQKGWPSIGIKSRNRPDTQVRIVENEYSQKYGLICIERLRQGMNYSGKHKAMPPTMQLYYLNPRKDYICQRLEEYRRLNAPWQKDKSWLDGIDSNNIRPDATSITQVTQYNQTDSGKWYPVAVTCTIVGVRKDGTPGIFTTNEMIFVKMTSKFPEGIFAPENLP